MKNEFKNEIVEIKTKFEYNGYVRIQTQRKINDFVVNTTFEWYSPNGDILGESMNDLKLLYENKYRELVNNKKIIKKNNNIILNKKDFNITSYVFNVILLCLIVFNCI